MEVSTRKFDSGDGDSFRIKNALAALMFARGAPIIYYGTEQGLDGHQANVLEQLGCKEHVGLAWTITSSVSDEKLMIIPCWIFRCRMFVRAVKISRRFPRKAALQKEGKPDKGGFARIQKAVDSWCLRSPRPTWNGQIGQVKPTSENRSGSQGSWYWSLHKWFYR